MSCEHTATLHGYLDGELDAARSTEFERHLESCPACVAELETQETLRSSFQHAQLRERAPSSLRQAINQQFRPQTSAQAAPASAARSWTWLAVAAGLLLAAIIGFRYLSFSSSNQAESVLAAQIVDAHLRSLQPGHLVDVISSDQHTVKPWFDGKLEFAPPVRDFAADGFPLQGGRLDAIGGRTVAALVYGRRKHEVNLFVWPAATSHVTSETTLRAGEQSGYHWIRWEKDGMEFWLVSDVAADDLIQLQQLLSQ
jgi:mycothiol system anti-sigma-R factor